MNLDNVWDPYSEFARTELNNGLNVYSAQWPGRPWEGVNFLIHTGARHDPIDQVGIAHFVEHLVSENSGGNARNLIDFFEEVGGSVNLGATTWQDVTYSFFVPINGQQTIFKAFDIFGKMLLEAQLVDNLEAERQVIVNEYNDCFPTQLSLDLAFRENKALFSGFWLENMVRPIGLLDTINKLSQKDLQEYYDLHYNPANISIIAIGGLSHQDVLEEIFNSPFSKVAKGLRTVLAPLEKEVPRPKENHFFLQVSDYSNQKINHALYYSAAAIPGKIDIRKVKIVRDMLYYELRREIREKRSWAYSTEVSVNNYGNLYHFEITSDLSLDVIHYIDDVIDSCINDLAKPVGLFEKMKNSILKKIFMIDVTAKEICDNIIDDLSLNGKIITLKEEYEALLAITEDDLQEVLEYLRPERRWTYISKP